MSDRWDEMAKRPFLRPGGENFDCAYALEICEANDRVELRKLIEANPGKAVVYDGFWQWGFVPND